MNYLMVDSVSKAFGERVLFDNITFGIDAGQKIALIARNGIGKTTLLNIIAGEESPDTGSVIYRNGIRVSFLSQNPTFDENKNVVDVLFDVDNSIMRATRRYEEALYLMDKDANVDSEELHRAMSQMDAEGAWDYEAKVKEVLSRFDIKDFHQKVKELSGGQRKKIALAKVLIDNADLLILDEPTNHLDITVIEWLEDYLSRQKLSLLVVTHDRYFLDKVCNEVVELDRGQIFKYKGDYPYYLEKKSERVENENAEIEKAKNLYRKELDWMRRQPQARGTKAKARIDSFYDIEDKAKMQITEKGAEFKVKIDRLGSKILEINYLTKSFGSNKLMENFVYTFKKGDKVGIVGKNGCGKSTFLNLIMGLIKPDKGTIVVGDTVKFGYYTQSGLQVDEDMRVIDILRTVADEIPMGKVTMSAAQFLYRFGYSKEVQWSPFCKLSGGERRKLYLLMVLMQNPNFLILDEPTNDLDIYTLDILEEFLQNYDGCLIVVSHDRYFMDRIVDHIFAFNGNANVKDFPGNYTDYLMWQQNQNISKKEQVVKAEKAIKVSSNTTKPSYKQKLEYQTLTNDIEELEVKRGDLMNKLNSGVGSPDEFKEWSLLLNELINSIEEKEMRWLELSDSYEF